MHTNSCMQFWFVRLLTDPSLIVCIEIHMAIRCCHTPPPTHVSVWMHTPIFGIGFRFTPPRKLAHALTFSFSILTHTCKAQTPRLFLLPQNWFSVLSTQHCSFNPTLAAHCYSKNEHRAEFSPNSTPTVSAKPERKRKKKAQFSFTGTTCANASEHNR